MQAVRLHRFDVGRPLIDEGDIKTRVGKVSTDAATNRTRAENGYLFVSDHHIKLGLEGIRPGS